MTEAFGNQPLASLFVSRWGPVSPKSGSALRNLQNIRALANLGTVDVVSIGVEETTDSVEFVREWKHFQITKLYRPPSFREDLRSRLWRFRFNKHPFFDAYWHDDVAAWIESRMACHPYDVAVISEVSLARYLPFLRPRVKRVIYDAHNVESVLAGDLSSSGKSTDGNWWRSMTRNVLRRRMAREEKRLVERTDATWACSESDAVLFRKLFGSDKSIVVVPNGVNVAAYPGNESIASMTDWSKEPVTVLYMGSYPYYPNEDAAIRLVRDILPHLRRHDPRVKAVLVGRDPTPAMRAAAADDPSVVITGAVESIMPFLTQPCVVALPITLGGGTRLKILEAFAAGTPVVSSRKGAEGIDATDGVELFLCDDPEEFARAVIRVWTDAALRRKLCGAAHRLVSERYSWSCAERRIAASLGREVASSR